MYIRPSNLYKRPVGSAKRIIFIRWKCFRTVQQLYLVIDIKLVIYENDLYSS